MVYERVRCRSGVSGSRYRLRDNYYSYQEWENYAEMYGLHTRLGFKSPKTAWRANPLVESSTIPSDCCKVVAGRRIYHEV